MTMKTVPAATKRRNNNDEDTVDVTRIGSSLFAGDRRDCKGSSTNDLEWTYITRDRAS
jgi:hypothetical protein